MSDLNEQLRAALRSAVLAQGSYGPKYDGAKLACAIEAIIATPAPQAAPSDLTAAQLVDAMANTWNMGKRYKLEEIEDKLRAMLAAAPAVALTQAATSEPVATWSKVPTFTMNGHQLREALEFINPDGAADELQADDELTFGVVQHKDDDGNVTTGLCCWNDDTDGVYPLDGEPRAATAPVSAAQTDDLSAKMLDAIYRACQRGDSPERLHTSVMAVLSAGAPVSAAGPVRMTNTTTGETSVWTPKAAPADGQELPAPNHEEAAQLAAIKRGGSNLARCYLDLATRQPQQLPALPSNEELESLYEQHAGHPADFGAAVLERWGGWQPGLLGHGGSLAMRQPQQAPTTYRQVTGWECSHMEPDPAGEWVKRADLAMGQAQFEAVGLIVAPNDEHPDLGWHFKPWKNWEAFGAGATLYAPVAAKQAMGQQELPACERCKYWDRADEDETGHSLGLGRCAKIPMFWDATKWNDEGEAREFKPEFKSTGAFAQDGSDYWAKVLTKTSFSCASFAAKQAGKDAQ